jgi:hypothetical protein
VNINGAGSKFTKRGRHNSRPFEHVLLEIERIRDHIHKVERETFFNLEQVLRTSFSTCVLVSLLRTKCAVEMITKP